MIIPFLNPHFLKLIWQTLREATSLLIKRKCRLILIVLSNYILHFANIQYKNKLSAPASIRKEKKALANYAKASIRWVR
ncbi:hypothetical protein B9G39_04105 [Zooshikella ganghwensis]|uniref:Uncharacterized protein n=1 Tax=Zooshikella ganghwensis TaxID=202772 RepID=A0A4P9VHP2_9GAMM|nr:hypothetical protein B9G39_04105 [Zooshikella ganghwensis]